MAIINLVGTEFRVNDLTVTGLDFPFDIITLANGNFAVSFGSSGTRVKIYDPSGAPVGSEFPALSGADGQLAALSNDNFVVAAWNISGSGPDAYARVFSPTGSAVTAAFPIATETAGQQSTPVICALDGGRFAIVWRYGPAGSPGASREIAGQIFAADGSREGGEFSVVEGTAGQTLISGVLAMPDGGFTVIWKVLQAPRQYDISAQRFDSSGNAVGGEITVISGVKADDATTTLLGDGDLATVWADGEDVYALITDSNGGPGLGPFKVNGGQTDRTEDPAIVLLSDGNFAVVWKERVPSGPDAGSDGIKAQLFDALGARIGTEFLVNTLTQGVQSRPFITALADSGFVVTWLSNSSDTHAQIFRFAGNGTSGDAGANIVLGTAADDLLQGAGGNDTLYGASGNDRITGDAGDDSGWGGNGKDRLDSGSGVDNLHGEAGNDTIYFYDAMTAEDVADGGAGSDTLYLRGDYANLVFSAATVRGIETINLAKNYSYRLTTHDATVANGTTLTIEAGGLHADETLYFDGSAETGAGSRFVIVSGEGSDTLGGGAGGDVMNAGIGRDTLFGYAGNDTLTGGANSDRIITGNGNDVVAYADAVESSSRNFDTIVGFNANLDRFDLPGTVTGIDPTIATGRLRESDLNTDLAAAANATTLLPGHAVLFTPDRGDHAGKTFLIVDANGLAGYQAREDFVFLLENSTNLAGLTPADFI